MELPEVPDGITDASPIIQQSLAWKVLWQWCAENGLETHSFKNIERYEKLLGPQMVAQWILDLMRQRDAAMFIVPIDEAEQIAALRLAAKHLSDKANP